MPSDFIPNAEQTACWLYQTPMLMQTPPALDGLAWLKGISPHPACQPAQPDDHRRRLGHHYESLINSWLAQSSTIVSCHANVQVIEHKRTLGEFDLLCMDQQNLTHHLECAVKFYLCDGPASQLASFVGPNRRDSLARKWPQMAERQIHLSDTDAGRATCQAQGLPTPVLKHLLIQGILFYPFGEAPPRHLHPAINPQHRRGWWLRQRSLDRLWEEDSSSEMIALQIRHKPDWLGDWMQAASHPTDVVRQQLTGAKRPVMVSRLAASATQEGQWREMDRGFVVPDNWGV